MGNKSISELSAALSASKEDLLVISKKETDGQYFSYSIKKEDLYAADDFKDNFLSASEKYLSASEHYLSASEQFLSASESFLSSNITLSQINYNEISGYAKDRIADSDVPGQIKTGYVQSEEKNYPVKVTEDGNAFVHVPWTGGSAADVAVDDRTIKKDEDNKIYVNELSIASRDFVNSSIQNMAAFYITKNEDGDPFETYAELSSATEFYYAGIKQNPTRNDYCIVLEDETQTTSLGVNPTTRYTYVSVDNADSGSWQFQYVVNNTALTQDQIDAINSKITSNKVQQIESIAKSIAELTLSDFKLSTIVGEDEQGHTHTYQILMKTIDEDNVMKDLN